MITPTEHKINKILDEKPGPRMLTCGEAMAIADLLVNESTYPYPIIPKILDRLAVPEIATLLLAVYAFYTIRINRDKPSEEQKAQLLNYINSIADYFMEAPKFKSYYDRTNEIPAEDIVIFSEAYDKIFQDYYVTNLPALRDFQKRNPFCFSPAIDFQLADMQLNAFFSDHEEAESWFMLMRRDLYLNQP